MSLRSKGKTYFEFGVIVQATEMEKGVIPS